MVTALLIHTSYIGEPEATRAAFDEEGYYKSGDLGHFDGKHYIIDGRVSQDCTYTTYSPPAYID